VTIDADQMLLDSLNALDTIMAEAIVGNQRLTHESAELARARATERIQREVLARITLALASEAIEDAREALNGHMDEAAAELDQMWEQMALFPVAAPEVVVPHFTLEVQNGVLGQHASLG
jgi:hypothetical protein